MNIFVTHKDAALSASYLDDKRVVKMCLETAQILSTALRLNGYTHDDVYKATHIHHPVVKWASETRLNYLWLLEHFQALCSEYTERYGKEHKCEQLLLTFLRLAHFIPKGFQTPFLNCAANKSTGIDYSHVDNVHLAYKLYLADRWEHDKREPTWFGVSK